MHMDHELIDQSKRLNDATRYEIGALDSLYSDDFLICRFNNRGETMIFDKQATIAFFAGKRDEGEAQQDDDAVEFLHASKSGDVGMVVGKRTLQIGDKPEELLFTQVWRRQADGWQIIRESVYVQAAPGT